MAGLGEEEALSFEEVLSFGLVCNVMSLTCTLLEGEHYCTPYVTMMLIRGRMCINWITLCGQSLVKTVTTSYFVLGIFRKILQFIWEIMPWPNSYPSTTRPTFGIYKVSYDTKLV